MKMMKINARSIAESLFASIAVDAKPLLLHDVIADFMVSRDPNLGINQALELSEPLLEDIKRLIQERQAAAEDEGIVWTCELYGSDYEYVRGSSFNDPTLNPAEMRARAQRAHVASVESSILELSPTEFERACTAILILIGCTDPRTSPVSDDGGIDFYGRLELEGRLDIISPYGGVDRRTGVWLIGQAKHYPKNAIQTAHLRELVGSVELARTKGAIHMWEGLDLRPFDPVIQLIFTTGKFSSGSQRLLDKSGMIALNGKQLATFLCDAGVGIDSGVFSKAKFRHALGLG